MVGRCDCGVRAAQKRYYEFGGMSEFCGMAIGRCGGLIEEELSRSAIGAFFKVHRTLGFGFMEHVYVLALELELRKRGHTVLCEMSVAVFYEGIEIAHQRLDMVIDGKLVIEVKATEKLHRDAARQLFNYLRGTRLEVGLLFHFGRSANFYRVISSNPTIPPIPPNSQNP